MGDQDGIESQPLEKSAKVIGSSPHNGAKTYFLLPDVPLWTPDWRESVLLWTCEDCGESGMSTFVQHCPQCGHCGCKNCYVYSPKRNTHCKPFIPVAHQDDIPTKDSVPNVLPPWSSPKPPLSSSSQASAAPEKDGRRESPVADERVTLLPLAKTPDLITGSDVELSLSYSAPVILTPSSTQESNISSGLFSHHDYIDSETEFEMDDTESADDLTDDEDIVEAPDYAVDILDSRLFSILGHDPELASRLIPQIHAQLQLGSGTETGVYTASPSQGSKEASEIHPPFSASTLTPGDGSVHSSSTQNKHKRERDESKDRGDNSGLKRRRKFPDRSAVLRRLYACHFHKKDPARYCPLSDSKFNMCLGRGNQQLRRMKDHYLKAHRPAQCERCYSIFEDRDELRVHRQAEPPCRNQPDVLKEGIDDSQWAKIEPLFHVRRNLSPSQKEQDDFNKWFQIWDILFPNVPRPPNPWVNLVPVGPSNALTNNAQGLLTNFNSIIELDVERGFLRRDDEAHQRYERAFWLALQINSTVSEPAVSFDQSFRGMNRPRNGSTEHSSERQVRVGVLENSLGQLDSSQPTPQHFPRSHRVHSSPRLETQLVLSPSRQFDIPEGSYTSRPPTGSASQTTTVPDAPTVFELPIDSRDIPTTQWHLSMSSSADPQSEAISPGQKPIEDPVSSNTEQGQDPELWDDLEFAEEPHFDLLQDDPMQFDANPEFYEEQFSPDSLINILESENHTNRLREEPHQFNIT